MNDIKDEMFDAAVVKINELIADYGVMGVVAAHAATGFMAGKVGISKALLATLPDFAITLSRGPDMADAACSAKESTNE